MANAGSVARSVSVVVSAVSLPGATTRAVTKSSGVAATGSTIGRARRDQRDGGAIALQLLADVDARPGTT